MTLGAFIAAARSDRKLTLRGLAKLTGVSATYLHHVEQGQRSTPSVDWLRKLANVLELDLRELVRMAGRDPELAADIVKRRPELLDVLLAAEAEPERYDPLLRMTGGHH